MVTALMLSQWRDTFLETGESGLKLHPVNESVEVGRLREKIARLEQNRPLTRESPFHSVGYRKV